jgi:3-oxo-5-alpha-steroid 4-dehydrogenase 3 / polyprenol reductase
MVSAPTAFNIATAITPCAYITLTVISLCSSFIPWLNSLASHGKTRQSNPTLVLNDRNRSLIELLNHKCLLVAKRRFTDFYAFGLIWSALVLGFRLDLTSTVMYCHFIRRYYECRYIHQWRDAKMHVAGYILGYIHYIFLPFIFVPDIPKNESFCLGVIAVGVNFMAQREQFLHHRILAKCRTEDHTKEYKIPCGRLFTYVCCPHYTAEILIYSTFLVLGYRGSGEYEFEKSFDNTENIIAIDFLNQCGRFIPYRHFILFIWVISNLAVSAHSNHRWYCTQFSSYPKGRAKLFPFIW